MPCKGPAFGCLRASSMAEQRNWLVVWAYEETLHRCSLLSCSMAVRASLAHQKRSIPAFPASLGHSLILHPTSLARGLILHPTNQSRDPCNHPIKMRWHAASLVWAHATNQSCPKGLRSAGWPAGSTGKQLGAWLSLQSNVDFNSPTELKFYQICDRKKFNFLSPSIAKV